MRKSKQRTLRQKSQPYDTSLKGWVKDNPTNIIPVLLPGAVFQEALDVEAIKPTMRADRVFKILYRSKVYILNSEFEEHISCMYPLLPFMRGANEEIIASAMAELKALYREGAAKTLREEVVKIVQVRFSDLAELAQQAVSQIANADNLNFLLLQVATAANETAARYILHPSAA